MNREEQKALVENKGWREFRDWVRESVEHENRVVVEGLDAAGLHRRRGRRDALEDVWIMVLAFEKEEAGEPGEKNG